MRTVATLSLFTLVPALAGTSIARAQQVGPASQPGVALAEPTQPYQTDPSLLPPPYQPPNADEYATDPAQVDWPQDVTPEEDTADSYDDGYDAQAYTQFQDELAPYGDWIDDGTYGRVWVPTTAIVGDDFTPYYSGGHWLLTEYGWTWISDWSWGWAPFHYGRWIIVSGYGWCWVPGTMWGPAWVAWRSGGGYVGWAALPPRGVSVTVTFGQRSPWRFTRAADLGAPRLHCAPSGEARGMFHRTTLVANDRVLTRGGATVHINAGPRYIPNATPSRLMAVAPHTFPQRAILPRPGATMYSRPWVRAATAGSGTGAGPSDGRPIPGSGVGTVRGGSPAGRGVSGRPPVSEPPRIYNPPRAFPSSPPAHTFASTAPTTVGPRIISNPTPASAAPRVHEAARFDNAPRASFVAPRASFGNQPASYGAPRTFGAPPSTAPHAYSAPPRTYGQPAVVNPSSAGFASSPVRVYSPPARTLDPPPVQHAPAQSFHQAFTPPATHVAPAHNFGAPAAGTFGGGGAHFGGGGHRR